MRPRSKTLTPQELSIMRVIWDRGPSTVRDVYEAIRTERKVAYTTVMTMMKILEQKGHLTRSPKDRAYIYRPAKPRQKVIRGMVHEFVQRVFDGSAQQLLVHLVEENKVTEKELKEIRRMLKDKS